MINAYQGILLFRCRIGHNVNQKICQRLAIVYEEIYFQLFIVNADPLSPLIANALTLSNNILSPQTKPLNPLKTQL